MNTDERIDYAESECRKADLDASATASILAYLLGAILTHFDSTPVTPLTDSRWFRLVRTAIAEVA